MNDVDSCWHLQTVTNGGEVKITKAFLTKEQAIFRANRICHNPATDEEKSRYEEAYKEFWEKHPNGYTSYGASGDSYYRSLRMVEVWHPDEYRDETRQRISIEPVNAPFRY